MLPDIDDITGKRRPRRRSKLVDAAIAHGRDRLHATERIRPRPLFHVHHSSIVARGRESNRGQRTPHGAAGEMSQLPGGSYCDAAAARSLSMNSGFIEIGPSGGGTTA